MKNLINFLIRYHAILLFLVLEAVCFIFMVEYNNFQKTKLSNTTNSVVGFVYRKRQEVIDYFKLSIYNINLAEENSQLREENYVLKQIIIRDSINTNLDNNAYRVVSAKVINNSINHQYNYITLDKGSLHGIKPDMGVVCQTGIVGVIISVSKNYSIALSVLNNRWSINSKLAKTGHFGPLRWVGQNPYIVTLFEIPYHVEVQLGEEVVTSGYSSIFPEDIPIGRVVKIEHDKSDNFQRLQVQLSSDFNNLDYVDVIEIAQKEEINNLETEARDE